VRLDARVAPRGDRHGSWDGTDPNSVTIAGDHLVYVLNAGSETIVGFSLTPRRSHVPSPTS
jgi:hypothetical protein